MIRSRRWIALLALAAAPSFAQDRCDNCGRIESIRESVVREEWTSLGGMSTPSASGDFGSQSGRVTTTFNVATGNMVMLGAAGGAGYAKRPNAYQRPRWQIVVKMDTGGVRTVTHDYEPALREGDRVRVYGTQLEAIS